MNSNSHFQLNPSSTQFAQFAHVKVAILSDSHSHIDDRVLRGANECDLVIHAGDICDPNIFFGLAPLQNSIYAVRGNNDQPHLWNTHDQAVLNQIPERLDIQLPGGTLSVEHGHLHGHHQPSHDSLRQAHADSRMAVYGHTHKRVFENQHSPWILNPGASGATRTHGGPGYAVLEASNETWEIELIAF